MVQGQVTAVGLSTLAWHGVFSPTKREAPGMAQMFAFVSAFPKSLHCTDEAQQAETVLSAVLSIYAPAPLGRGDISVSTAVL